MPIKSLLVILLLLPCRGLPQAESDEGPAAPEPGNESPLVSGRSELSSPRLDSLERSLALLEVAKAREALTSSNFFHRLIPQVSVQGGIGLRELAFPDAGGALLLPKDSYRLSIGLSLSNLFDGAAHARAEIRLAEAETRLSLLAHRQALARLALGRKRVETSSELAALRDELSVRATAVACQELLFAQGRADFRALAGARVDLIRLRHAAGRLERRLREIEFSIAGECEK